MKILLVGCFDLYLHPYSEKYIAAYKNHDIKFIYWNRNNSTIPKSKIYNPFNYSMNTYQSLFGKIRGYISFYKFVKIELKNNKYDRIIFLTSQAMFLFGRYARKYYKNRYLYDFRDETYEKYEMYRRTILKCILSSYKTVVSSNGFLELFPEIPQEKFILCHNAKNDFSYQPIRKESKEVVNISFWGMIRQPEYFKNIIFTFANNKKYKINFYGQGYIDQLRKIIKDNNINNVYLYGKYEQNDMIKFVKDTDILINCYSNNSIQKKALTVKMYEGIMYNIPMIIQKDSYMDFYLNSLNYPHYSIDFDNYSSKNEICLNELVINNGRGTVNKILEQQKLFTDELFLFVK